MDISPVTLTGKLVRLEPMSLEHLDSLSKIAFDPNIWRYMLYGDIQTRDDLQRWIEDILSRQAKGTDLAFTAILSAALDGIDKGMKPPKPLNNVNVYHLTEEERRSMNIASLPGSLAEALDELSRDLVIQEALGAGIYEAFSRAKWAEWDEYRTQVSDWEIAKYLEQF